MESLATLINALTPLLWVGLMLFVIIKFTPVVREILESAKLRKFTLKIGGQELTMEELTDQQSKLLSDLQSQIEALRKQVLPENDGVKLAEEEQPALPPVMRRSVLWVDDNPKNNSFIVQMLNDKDIPVEIALSTQEAMQLLKTKSYGVIVSDMGREEDGQFHRDAGVNLVTKVRQRDAQIPYIIYCSGKMAREYGPQALEAGATSVTSSPSEVSGTLLRLLGGVVG